MDELSQLLTDADTTIAVVGATDNPDKYGSVIYRDLKRKGYRVFAVNPGRETVDGDPAYPTVADLPVAPDIVDLVVPASVGLNVSRQSIGLGYIRIWLQPGAESPELLTFLQDAEADYIANSCIMVESRRALTAQ